MSNKFDVIIIGSGIGGLICGNYLSKLGLRTLILEQQNQPGGYCTSFQRKGYRFDSAVHYLSSIKKGIFGKILEELELNDKIAFHQFDPADKIVMPENVTFVRANPYDTIKEFKKSFPQEHSNIDLFFDIVLKQDILKLISKLRKITFDEFLNDIFTDNRIKATISILLGNIGSSAKQTSALAAAIFFREFIFDPAYYPLGGMQTLPNILVKELLKHNGEIRLKTEVKTILIKEGRVEGIVTGNDETVFSQTIVSNIDATQTFKSLLKDHPTKEAKTVDSLIPSSSAVALYLAIKKHPSELVSDFSNIWHCDTYDVENVLTDFNSNLFKDKLPFVMVYFPTAHDKTQSKHTIQALMNAPFESEEFWLTHKKAIYEKLLFAIKKAVPKLKDSDIDFYFGASPVTFKRYTQNKSGAIYGWMSSLAQNNATLVPQTSSIPGLFLTGHWCISGVGGEGGIAGVAALGRNAARLIINKNGLKWPWEIFILK